MWAWFSWIFPNQSSPAPLAGSHATSLPVVDSTSSSSCSFREGHPMTSSPPRTRSRTQLSPDSYVAGTLASRKRAMEDDALEPRAGSIEAQSPRKKAAKKKPDGKEAEKKSESKAQMLDRLRSQAEALCKSKKSDTIEIDGSSFRLIKELGAGADALIFQAVCVNGKVKGRIVAVKMQPRHKDTRWQITTEQDKLQQLRQLQDASLRVQEKIAYGQPKAGWPKDEGYILVTGLLGPTLLDLGDDGGKHSARNVLVLAHQALVLFEQLHSANLLHRDIKPENLVLGCEGTADALKLHMIDFGTSESLVDRHGARRTEKQNAEGSVPYMAVSVHEKQPLGKRDDVESLIWTLLRLCLGKLPWEHGKVAPAGMVQRKRRMKEEGVKAEETCKDMEPYMKTCMSKMLAHVQGLQKPESEPKYAALRKHVEAAWKSGGFTPREVSKADVSY